MRKIISIAAVSVASALALSACGTSEDVTSAPAPAPVVAEVPAEPTALTKKQYLTAVYDIAGFDRSKVQDDTLDAGALDMADAMSETAPLAVEVVGKDGAFDFTVDYIIEYLGEDNYFTDAQTRELIAAAIQYSAPEHIDIIPTDLLR